MKRLPCPIVDIDNYVSQLVIERAAGVNAALFAGLEAEWKDRCMTYHDASGYSAAVTRWPLATANKNTFINLYNHPGENSTQRPYLDSLRDRTLRLCPLCGEAGTPNTLDHYLPKEHFPHFAVLPQNLVPACDICQGAKLSEYECAEGRTFAHLYYDDFLGGQVLRLEIHPPYTAPGCELRCHPDLPPEHQALVLRHISGIDLATRYAKSFRTEYRRLLRLAQDARANDTPVVTALEMFKTNAAYHSLSSWEHILYEGVMSDPNLMEFLEAGELPPFL